jgi:2-polyprenyl-3-methyl-5-hydroxy-6-metoxy-1,4-benzoquinol methylase
MTVKISGGAKENGIVVGNAYDKYGSRNPIVKWMMKGFESALSALVTKASPQVIHEIGGGEGYWVLRWKEQGLSARGCDFSTHVIKIARENATRRGISPLLFEPRSIYDLEASRDSADLIVCCEVLEHLEHPDIGLQALQRVVGRHLIVSVPNAPLEYAESNLREIHHLLRQLARPHSTLVKRWLYKISVKLFRCYRGETSVALDHSPLQAQWLKS